MSSGCLSLVFHKIFFLNPDFRGAKFYNNLG